MSLTRLTVIDEVMLWQLEIFQMKFHYNTFAFGIRHHYFYKTLLPFVNTWFI